MYPILSFQLSARPGISDGNVIHTLMEWVSKSPHYDFILAQLDDILAHETCSHKNVIGKAALLLFQRHSLDGVHYIAMRLERPDEEGNFLWRAECIYAREESGGKPGSFHIHLSRGPLDSGLPVDLNAIPNVPYIARLLHQKGWIAENKGGEEAKNVPGFPVILCGRRSEGNERYGDVFDHLRRKLSSIAQICGEGSDPLLSAGKGRPEGMAGIDGVRVLYPAAGMEREYPDAMAMAPESRIVGRILEDVIRWVSEVHSAGAVPWPEQTWPEAAFDAGDVQSSYCIMNADMADRLRSLRRQQGLSQKELAARVDSTGLIISRLETGRMQRVPRLLLHEIERALGVAENTLVSLQRRMKEPVYIQTEEEEPEEYEQEKSETGQSLRKTCFCRRCGRHLYQDSRFCPGCGTKVLD